MKRRLKLAILLVVAFSLCRGLTVRAQMRTITAGLSLQGAGGLLRKRVSVAGTRHRSTPTPTRSPTPTRTPTPTPTPSPTPTPAPSPTPGGITPTKANDFLNRLGVDTHIIQGIDSTAQVITSRFKK